MKISFVCPLINRGRLFTNLYHSLSPIINRGHEFVVADYDSNDVKLSEMCATIVKGEPPFRRSKARNTGAKHATGDIIFFVDADMIVPPKFDIMLKSIVLKGRAYFPICYSLYENKPPVIQKGNGWWRNTGFGMCGFHRRDYFDKVKGWNEKFIKWGREDDDIHARTIQSGIVVIRQRCKGLFHQWHPKDKKFKDKHVS